MAEFAEIIKIQNRICNEYAPYCTNCPLKLKDDTSCNLKFVQVSQDFEQICLKWKDENPVITNRDKLQEVFPNMSLINICPCNFGLVICEDSNCNRCRSNWLNAEYQPPKEENK